MIRFSKPAAWLTLFLTFAFVIETVLLGFLPGTVQAAGTSILSQLPESKPGNFTVRWYSGKRYWPGWEPGNMAGIMAHSALPLWTAVDKSTSDAALQNYYTSVSLGQEHISDLTFDMTRWQPDTEYHCWYTDVDAELKGEEKLQYNWNWCEVDGFIRLPDLPPNAYFVKYSVGIDPLQRSDVNCDLEVPGNGSLSPGAFVPFRLRIKCYQPDQSKLNAPFSIAFNYTWAGWGNIPNMTIPAGDVYGSLGLKDMKPFFQLDPQYYTLTLNPNCSALRVEDYEYGYAGGTDFKPLALGANYLEPGSGDVIVRFKSSPHLYITVGAITMPVTGNLSITGRTPTTASLAWFAPSGSATPIAYDIYRQKVGAMTGFSPPNAIVTVTVDNPVLNAGSTSGLTFTDQGLSYDSVYAYYVAAKYSAGNSTVSNTVQTDSVTMQGLPSIPDNLKIELASQASKADLKLNWDASSSQAGIKEYVVYRRLSQDSTGTQNPDGSFTLGGITESNPREIARTPVLGYIDRGLNLTDTCEYCVQAVDKNGIPSYISSPLEVSLQKFIPPTPPGGLRAGSVLRQGDSLQYDFPDVSPRNVLMGPQREVALRWDSSSDNTGIVGYIIYRMEKNPAASAISAGGTPLGPSSRFTSLADNPVAATATGASDSIGKEYMVGATEETFFVDRGLDFGKGYFYYVEARDTDGNTAGSQVSVGTGKSSLADLAITDGSQPLVPEPAFAYYQTQYTLNVENSVKSITLTPKKTDPQARVKVNGIEAAGDSGIPVVLDPGENTVLIDVIPREGPLPVIKPETVRYTLAVNRANLDQLPVLTLPEGGTVLDEGSMYKAAGRIVIPNGLVWTGTADYGDGSGEKPLQLNKVGTFVLNHQYLDNGQYKIHVSFRYNDLGLVKGSLEVTVQNVAPSLTGPEIKDEITTQEGTPLTIEGSIADPGQDTWTVTGDHGSEWGPTQGTVNVDKTFILQDYFNDLKPEYDMVLKVTDDDGGVFTKNIKIRVENVAPSVQAGEAGMVQRGTAFTGAGVFTDPGLDRWQATVDFGDGSGEQPLTLKNDKTFDLSHTYLKTGIFTVTVRVEDQDGGMGSVSFQVKVKDYLFTLEAGADASLQEGEKLARDIPVRGRPDKVKSIAVDYGDGTPVALSNKKLAAPPMADKSAQAVQSVPASSVEKTWVPVLPQIGVIPLQHVYTDNGAYTVTIKLTDMDGDSYEDSFQVEAVNVPPAVQMERIANMYVGNTFTGRGSITDPGADTWTVEIDFKDGSDPCKTSLNPDKTFSFSHSYRTPGNYNIEAVVRDDDGGIGQCNQQATVLAPSGGGSSISHDASLHSFAGLPNLKQDDDIHGYTDDGFIPACLIYTCSGAFMHTSIEVSAAPGATITYTIDGGAVQDLPQNTSTGIDLDVGSTLTITVTAEDGITTSEYTFTHI